jgi:hypothetical protein
VTTTALTEAGHRLIVRAIEARDHTRACLDFQCRECEDRWHAVDEAAVLFADFIEHEREAVLS